MMRSIRLVFLVVLSLAILTFALANRSLVTFSLLPEDIAVLLGWQWRIDLPLFVLVGLGCLVGLALGFVWEWLREHKHRKTARVQTRAVSRLERELATMKDQTSLPDDEVIALLERPRAS